MVFSNYLIYKLLNPTKEKLREEGREQGLQMGREQGISHVLQLLPDDERERLQAKLQAAQADDPARTRNGAQ